MPELAFSPNILNLNFSSKSATSPPCHVMKLFSGGRCPPVALPVRAPSSTDQKLMSGDFHPSSVLPSKITFHPSTALACDVFAGCRRSKEDCGQSDRLSPTTQ